MNLFFHLNFPRKKQKNKKTKSKAASRPVRPSHSETTSRTERHGRGTRAGTGSSWEVRERERGGGAAPPLFFEFSRFFPPSVSTPLSLTPSPLLSLSFHTPPKQRQRPPLPPEGAGVLVLESLEHARARGATILCEFAGGALGCDAHHMTEPRPDGSGVRACIEQAVRAGERASRFLAFRRSRSIPPLRESGRGGRRKFFFVVEKKSSSFLPSLPSAATKTEKNNFSLSSQRASSPRTSTTSTPMPPRPPRATLPSSRRSAARSRATACASTGPR